MQSDRCHILITPLGALRQCGATQQFDGIWEKFNCLVIPDPCAVPWMFPSHHPVRLSSLYDLCRRTESRGKAASRNSLHCRAVRCLCEKRYSALCQFYTTISQCHLPNCHVLCFRRWRADEARILRVSVSSFLDHLSLVLETMEMFGPPVSQ